MKWAVLTVFVLSFPLTDKNEFVANSGWFTFPGMSEGKSALEHVLARKANMKYDKFMGVRKSVYRLKYRHEKVSFLNPNRTIFLTSVL